MKKILLLLVLSFSLISCVVQNTTEIRNNVIYFRTNDNEIHHIQYVDDDNSPYWTKEVKVIF